MHKEEPKINCSAFLKQEPVIRGITDKINKAKGVQEKSKYAEELQKESNVLLNCLDYEEEILDCKNCHFIANLRKKAADLIIKARSL